MDQAQHPQELVHLRSLLIRRYISRTVSVSRIRQESLGNIVRWRSQGSDFKIWDEWVKLMMGGSDQLVIDVLTNDAMWRTWKLHRAPVYAGLISPQIREYIFSRPLTDLPTLEDLKRFDEIQQKFIQLGQSKLVCQMHLPLP